MGYFADTLTPYVIEVHDESGWDTKVREHQIKVGIFFDNLAVSAGQITPAQIHASNAPAPGYGLEIDLISGDFVFKSRDVKFPELPGQASFSGGELVRVKADRSAMEPVHVGGIAFAELPGQANFSGGELARVKADKSAIEPVPNGGIGFRMIDCAGSTGGTKLIIHNGAKPELVNSIPVSLYGDGTITWQKWQIIGTPLPGYYPKWSTDMAGNTILIASPNANTEDTGMMRHNANSPYQWGSEWKDTHLPSYSAIGKVLDNGTFVDMTASSPLIDLQNKMQLFMATFFS